MQKRFPADDAVTRIAEGLLAEGKLPFRADFFSLPVKTVEVRFTVSGLQEANLMEEMLLSAASANLPDIFTVEETARLMGVDPVFVQHTADSLAESGVLVKEKLPALELSPAGREYAEKGCVPRENIARQVQFYYDLQSRTAYDAIAENPACPLRTDLPQQEEKTRFITRQMVREMAHLDEETVLSGLRSARFGDDAATAFFQVCYLENGEVKSYVYDYAKAQERPELETLWLPTLLGEPYTVCPLGEAPAPEGSTLVLIVDSLSADSLPEELLSRLDGFNRVFVGWQGFCEPDSAIWERLLAHKAVLCHLDEAAPEELLTETAQYLEQDGIRYTCTEPAHLAGRLQFWQEEFAALLPGAILEATDAAYIETQFANLAGLDFPFEDFYEAFVDRATPEALAKTAPLVAEAYLPMAAQRLLKEGEAAALHAILQLDCGPMRRFIAEHANALVKLGLINAELEIVKREEIQ